MNEVLKEGARGSSGRHGLQRGLVVVEVALALILAASAGLMIRTMWRLGSVDPGFDPHNVLVFGVAGSPAVHGTPAAIRNGFAETSRQLRVRSRRLRGEHPRRQHPDEHRLLAPVLGRRSSQAGRAEPDGQGALLRRRTRVLQHHADTADARPPAERPGQREHRLRDRHRRGVRAQGVPGTGPARPARQVRSAAHAVRDRRRRRPRQAVGPGHRCDLDRPVADVHRIPPVSGQRHGPGVDRERVRGADRRRSVRAGAGPQARDQRASAATW